MVWSVRVAHAMRAVQVAFVIGPGFWWGRRPRVDYVCSHEPVAFYPGYRLLMKNVNAIKFAFFVVSPRGYVKKSNKTCTTMVNLRVCSARLVNTDSM